MQPDLEDLTDQDRAELARIAAQSDCNFYNNGHPSHQKLMAKGLLDGRRGRALSPLGEAVLATLS